MRQLSLGRLTARGNDAVETSLAELVQAAAETIRCVLRPPEVVALLLVGELGRGEGSITVGADGCERPSGRQEFLLIASNVPEADRHGLEHRLNERLAGQWTSEGWQPAVRVITVAGLRTSQCSLEWCDTRFGHKLLFGDAALLLVHERFEIECLPRFAARDLLVAGLTPVLGFEAQSYHVRRDRRHRRIADRLAAEAVIAAGSAALLASGEYHWSLQERQCRVAEMAALPGSFKARFHTASERRFVAQREDLGSDDLAPIADLWDDLERVHLACERAMLRDATIDWPGFAAQALGGAARVVASPFNLVRAARALADRSGGALHLPVLTRLAYACAEPRELLGALLPMVLYDGIDDRGRALAQRLLGASSSDRHDLQREYLRMWSETEAADGVAFSRSALVHTEDLLHAA